MYLPCGLCSTRTARLGCGDGEEIGGFDDMQGRSAGIARDFVNKYLYFLHRSYIFSERFIFNWRSQNEAHS